MNNNLYHIKAVISLKPIITNIIVLSFDNGKYFQEI